MRKKLAAVLLTAVFCLALIVGGRPVIAEGAASGKARETAGRLADSTKVAEGVNSAAGTAVSPLLVLFCHGLYKNLTGAPEADLPWHAEPVVLTVLGVVLLFIFLKDTVPTGPLKKPLDAADEAIMPGGAILALIAVLPFIIDSLAPLGTFAAQGVLNVLEPSAAWASGGPESAVSFADALGRIIAAVAGTVMFAVVWLVSNAINVLCLLAPGFAGAILKAFRLTVVGGLYGLAAIHPLLGLAASILLIVVSVMLVRWSFRLTVWGGLFTYDLITRRWRKGLETEGLTAFGDSAAPSVLKVPKRVKGKLEMIDGRLSFSYRRFLLFPRTVSLPESRDLTVGRCLTAPLLAVTLNGRRKALLNFRLRSRSHERELAQLLNVPEVRDMGLRRTLGAWEWIQSLWRSKDFGECEAEASY